MTVAGISERSVTGARYRLGETRRPGLRRPGPGCKSPAGRRLRSGEWSAGRSAASRDGRRALIARSQDLPCPSRLDVTRERPEYSRADPWDACRRRDFGRMRRFPYCPGPPPARIPRSAPCTRKTWTGPAEPPPTGTAAVARRSSAYNETIASRCPGRRSSFLMTTGDKSRRTRSGSRPITHGCSVRDPRPGSSSTDRRRYRRPFEGPWPTPREPPVRRVSAYYEPYGSPCRRGMDRTSHPPRVHWSEACWHRPGTLVPAHRGTTSQTAGQLAVGPAIPLQHSRVARRHGHVRARCSRA